MALKPMFRSSYLTQQILRSAVACGPLVRPSETQLLNQGPSVSWSWNLTSLFHSYRLTNNLSFVSENKLEKPKDLEIVYGMKKERPLVLFLSWLKANEKNCRNYIEIYTDKGYDVLWVAINPSDLWQPVKRVQVVARDVTDFLEKNENFKQIMIHGMSVGAYAFCEIMFRMVEDRDRYQSVLDKFVGQIWDSPVDIHSAPIGTSKSLTENPHLQKLIQMFCTKLMAWKYDDITSYYYKAHYGYHGSLIDVPALFLISKVDPVSDLPTNNIIANKWKARGNDVKIVCFEDSPHVLHMRYNKEQYQKEASQFLKKVVTIPPVIEHLPNDIEKPLPELQIALHHN